MGSLSTSSRGGPKQNVLAGRRSELGRHRPHGVGEDLEVAVVVEIAFRMIHQSED